MTIYSQKLKMNKLIFKFSSFQITKFICLVLFSFNSFGQNFINDKNEWFDGKIMLERGDTLMGKMQYEMQTSILKLQTYNNTIKTYSARQIDAFDFFDPVLKEHRYFRTLMYTPKGKDYSTPSFFGLIYEGKNNKVSIYYKENLRNVYLWNTKTLVNDDLEIYFAFPDGSVKRFRRHTNSLFDLLTENQGDMKSFIEAKYLKTEILMDMVKIVDYYNSLLPDELLEEK